MSLGTKVARIEVDYNDLEQFVRKIYKLNVNDYDFVASQECGNDSKFSFCVEPEFDEKEWNEKQQKSFPYSNGMILNRLCYDGHIEAGDYLVCVSW